ncbi:MAG TPA: hypothetical protein G4N95_01185 [Anaerolineae bacterium]|nr:hypothetical protein [Anaerolineae bacterium]
MAIFNKFSIVWNALHELGFRQLVLYLWYQFLLKSRLLEQKTPTNSKEIPTKLRFLIPILPDKEELIAIIGNLGLKQLKNEANEILNGQVRLFGGEPRKLEIETPYIHTHWTKFESGSIQLSTNQDIKFIWELGRFGWAFTLARAYYLSGDESFAEGYWDYVSRFFAHNPKNIGPQWVSAQEVAIRLITLVFTAQIFALSPTFDQQKKNYLSTLIASHAQRILPSLAYALAQNNNHLLIEALGLLSAALALPEHPKSKIWYRKGWHWLNWAFQNQIDEEGIYIQQSVNYQRLMLQAALWANMLLKFSQREFPERTKRKLELTVKWMLSIVDWETGQMPNLGHNDGAYIFPLTLCSFGDYRPVLQAASYAFLGKLAFTDGTWNEMMFWFNDDLKNKNTRLDVSSFTNPTVLRNNQQNAWGYLRVAKFNGRPGHADQLHFDLWWRGINIAQDPGTYLYNGSPPWDNRLMSADVHNTVTIDQNDQMLRVGKFLYLEKAQGIIDSRKNDPNGNWKRIVGHHDGYRKLGIRHQRSVTMIRNGKWIIEDHIDYENQSKENDTHIIRLHWLLPDWEWELIHREVNKISIGLLSPFGEVQLHTEIMQSEIPLNLQVVRAGELVYGDGKISPNWGWVSLIYGSKIPALSFGYQIQTFLPLKISSEWNFPDYIKASTKNGKND